MSRDARQFLARGASDITTSSGDANANNDGGANANNDDGANANNDGDANASGDTTTCSPPDRVRSALRGSRSPASRRRPWRSPPALQPPAELASEKLFYPSPTPLRRPTPKRAANIARFNAPGAELFQSSTAPLQGYMLVHSGVFARGALDRRKPGEAHREATLKHRQTTATIKYFLRADRQVIGDGWARALSQTKRVKTGGRGGLEGFRRAIAPADRRNAARNRGRVYGCASRQTRADGWLG